MSRWKYFWILTVVASLGVLGCHKSSSSGVSITISPTTASVITNQTQAFSAFVTGASNNNTNVTFAVTCASGVASGTCGSISTTGTDTALYQAPATLPTTTSNGATSPAPAVTVTVTSQADTSKSASASLTLVTGITITITPSTATVGTGESFPFVATVSNPGCSLTANPTCENVTFSLSTSTSLSHQGMVTTSCTTSNGQPSCTGSYTADPTTVPSPSTVVLTATSVADTSVTSTASITIESAQTPTVSSVSPNQTALGALFQDVFITGTNFISTSQVSINGVKLDPSLVSQVNSSVIRARIPDFILAVPPATNILQIGVAEEGKTVQNCSDSGHDESLCQITVVPVRPGVVGTSPPSIPQGSGGQSFSVDGGFFGAGPNPAVTATFNGQIRSFQLPATGATGSTRQLTVSLGGSANPADFLVPGLYPVQITSAKDSTKMAVSNLAVQPSAANAAPAASTTIPVGTMPSDVAVNPATGVAVVANSGSNNVSLIDLTQSPPVLITSICTAAFGASTPCPSSGPSSVAVDYVRNIALVVNATSKTIAVVDLSTRAVTSIIQMPFEVPAIGTTPGTPAPPEAVGINPVTGRALVAMQARNYSVLLALLDLSKNPPVPLNPPAVIGVVTNSTGPNTHVGIEPNLNWAITTPGGGINGIGSIGIVDLSRQTTNSITNLSRSSNVVTVTVDSSSSAVPLAVHLGDAVQIQNVAIPGISDASIVNGFDGIYTVTSLGPSSAQFTYQQTAASLPDVSGQAATGSVNYSQPVTPGIAETNTIQGLGINPETQQAVLVDPANNGAVSFFSLIDQTLISTLTVRPNGSTNGPTAAAYNPLTNTIYAVNFIADALSVIAPPTTPGGRGQDLNDSNLSCTAACGPVAIAIDPGTNTAVIANQKDNSATVLNLGSIKPLSIVETSPKTAITTSTLGSGPAPAPINLTVIGKGLTCVTGSTGLHIRLDGNPLQTFCTGSGDRELTATVQPSMLSMAHRYALDVADSSGNVTNSVSFIVEQSIDVSSAACPNPFPSGVAVDPQQNLADVSLFGCGTVALINMTAGTGQPPGTGQTVTVGSGPGSGPIGVAIVPRLHLSVVANSGSTSASIVDEVQHTVKQTVTAGSGPLGAGADNETAEVAVANSLGNSATVVNASTLGTSTVSTGSFPVAAAYNYVNHELAVANQGSNTLGVTGVTGASSSSTFSVNLPTSVAYDPVPSDCIPSGNTTTTNTDGCFLVNSSSQDVLEIIDPLTSVQNAFRFGVNPTAIAYNFLTSTVVSTNTTSHTMTVADLPRGQVRSVFSLPAAPITPSLVASGLPQFALDIHPFLNVAVVADTANGRVLFIPLPF